MTPVTPPTDRQLRYLRTLAARTETTFVPPGTRSQASREIDRLIELSRTGRAPEPIETEPQTEEAAYATSVQPDEVCGVSRSRNEF